MRIGEHEVKVVSKDEVKVGCQTVKRGDVEQVLRLMDEWKPTPKLKVGDYVKVTAGDFRGEYGKVVDFDARQAAVEFAKPNSAACGCRRSFESDCFVPERHGAWISIDLLQEVD